MSRIGIDARMLSYTGIGRYIREIISRVPKQMPNDEFVIFTKPNESKHITFHENVSVQKTISSIYNFAEQTTHYNVLNNANLDLLHVPHFNAPLRYKKPLIITVHDLIQYHQQTTSLSMMIKKNVYKYHLKNTCRHANHILTVSEYTHHELESLFPNISDKISVTYNGLDPLFLSNINDRSLQEKLINKYGLKEKFLLHTGLAGKHKNVEILLWSLKEILSYFPNVQLVFGGKKTPKQQKHLEKLTKKLNIQDHVVFTGYLTDLELRALYQIARVFVFPSLMEGFGLPPLESLALGTPVISSNATSLPEILGNEASYFDPNDKESLTSILIRTLKKPKISTPSQIATRYTWDQTAALTVSAYEKVLQR